MDPLRHRATARIQPRAPDKHQIFCEMRPAAGTNAALAIAGLRLTPLGSSTTNYIDLRITQDGVGGKATAARGAERGVSAFG